MTIPAKERREKRGERGSLWEYHYQEERGGKVSGIKSIRLPWTPEKKEEKVNGSSGGKKERGRPFWHTIGGSPERKIKRDRKSRVRGKGKRKSPRKATMQAGEGVGKKKERSRPRYVKRGRFMRCPVGGKS